MRTRQNPLLMTVMGNPREHLRPRSAKVYCAMCGEWSPKAGPYHRPTFSSVGGKVLCDRCYRGLRSGRRAGESWAKNPLSRRGYQQNPYVLIDSGTMKIIRNWKGSMLDRKPWDWAKDAARRLNRNVYVVAHPHIPPTFRPGVEVSNIFLMMGPYAVVSPDGRTQSTKYNRNPGLVPAIAGGIAGSLVASAMSNPRRGPSEPDETAARELELYVSNDSQLYHSQFIPIVKNLMRRRAAGTYNSEKAAKLFLYLADAGAKKYYKEFSTSDSSFRFDLATRWATAKSLRDSFETEASLGNYDNLTFGVSNNPKGHMCEHGMVDRRRCHGCRTRKHARRRTALCPHGISGGKVGRDCVRCVEKRYGYKRNGEQGARKVTMPIEKFAALVKARKDPALWKDFVSKCKGYHKWSHGTWPKKVTIEAIKKPGMTGMWISFDMGREPEKTYVMPGGTKRKGAWKHPWERMPQLRGDAEAGFILTKLGKGNRLTDFLHGN